MSVPLATMTQGLSSTINGTSFKRVEIENSHTLENSLPKTLCALLIVIVLGLEQINLADSAIDYHQALTKSLIFFKGQRSGLLPSNNGICWRGDSGLTDGAIEGVDLTGGYYDAGDNVKFGWPMAHTVTMLSWSVIEYNSQLSASGELGNAHEAIRWATDFLLKAVRGPTFLYTQVGDGKTDHQCWERPEDMDTPRTLFHIDEFNPGSEVAADVAASLAAASIVFASFDPTYSTLLLTIAAQMFDFANNHRGSYQLSCPFYCSVSGYNDELLWAGAWMYKASNNPIYRQFVVDNSAISQSVNEFSWENKHAGVQILLSKVYFGGDASLEQYNTHATSFICAYLPNNPQTTVKRTPAGFAFTRDGNNAQYTLGAAFMLTVYGDYLTAVNKGGINCGGTAYNPTDIIAFAKTQLDYVLGANPIGISYMVGYGVNFPQQVHHRGASIPSIFTHPEKVACSQGYSTYYNANAPNPNVHEGAIVGGPDQNDQFDDHRTNFNHLEPITYINAPAVGLLARSM